MIFYTTHLKSIWIPPWLCVPFFTVHDMSFQDHVSGREEIQLLGFISWQTQKLMNLSQNSQKKKKHIFQNRKRLFQPNLTLNLWKHFPFGQKLVHPSSLGNVYSKYLFDEAQMHVKTRAKHLLNILVSWDANWSMYLVPKGDFSMVWPYRINILGHLQICWQFHHNMNLIILTCMEKMVTNNFLVAQTERGWIFISLMGRTHIKAKFWGNIIPQLKKQGVMVL